MPDQEKSESGGNLVVLTGVVARYPGASAPALSGVDLSVKAGEFVSVLGPSGCGKTTLLRVIAGFERVESGEVMLGDRLVSSPTRHVDPDRRNVGLVFQDYALFPHLTVAENVAFGLDSGERKGVDGVAKVLEMVGLDKLRDRYPHELSGGQQQRVALARSLAPDPVALLFDEPFSNLDRQLRGSLRREVQAIVREHGTTALLVTGASSRWMHRRASTSVPSRPRSRGLWGRRPPYAAGSPGRSSTPRPDGSATGRRTVRSATGRSSRW